MERLFIAVYPSDEILEKIMKLQDEVEDLFVGRLTNKESLHITLQFLGYIKEKDRKTVSENIRQSIKNTCPFEVVYRKVGFFRGVYDPRILWVGIEDQGSFITQIANNLRKANVKIAKKENRKFSLHVTIARIKSMEKENALEILEKYKNIEFGKDLVKEVCLVKSELGKDGSRYTVLEWFGLS